MLHDSKKYEQRFAKDQATNGVLDNNLKIKKAQSN